ncbi:hypothetical protein [Staphylococcus hominis]|uniref:hypothetical protein n=1 Tax=Staphylococcus hominis TaxID=1290 RepID=UPI0010F568D1|nr:hypothetical protein [Staphylococcus hominis]UQA64335.1 hypothetical protein Sta0113_06740 [Staphylococcus hominis subsp. hominis]
MLLPVECTNCKTNFLEEVYEEIFPYNIETINDKVTKVKFNQFIENCSICNSSLILYSGFYIESKNSFFFLRHESQTLRNNKFQIKNFKKIKIEKNLFYKNGFFEKASIKENNEDLNNIDSSQKKKRPILKMILDIFTILGTITGPVSFFYDVGKDTFPFLNNSDTEILDKYKNKIDYLEKESDILNKKYDFLQNRMDFEENQTEIMREEQRIEREEKY